MHLFYTEVNDQMRVSNGGGLEDEGELIEVIEMSPTKVESYIRQDCVRSPMFTMYGLTWFLNNKRNDKSNLFKFMTISIIGATAVLVGMMWGTKQIKVKNRIM